MTKLRPKPKNRWMGLWPLALALLFSVIWWSASYRSELAQEQAIAQRDEDLSALRTVLLQINQVDPTEAVMSSVPKKPRHTRKAAKHDQLHCGETICPTGQTTISFMNGPQQCVCY
jgi:hypothetical protein